MEEIQRSTFDLHMKEGMKKDFSRIGLSLTVYLLVVMVCQYLAAVIGGLFPAFTANGWYTWIVVYLPQVLIGAPVCLLMLRKNQPRESVDEPYGAGNYILLFIMCIPVMYIGNIIGIVITSFFGAGNALAGIVTDSDVWATLLFAVILAPLVEELIFRKMIITRLRKYGDKTAILVSALLFALMHGNFSQMFYAFGLGVLFGYVYARTGRLRYSIGLHMMINFLGSIVGGQILRMVSELDLDALSGINPMDTEAVSQLMGAHMSQLMAVGLYVLTMIGLAVAGLVLLIVRRKRVVLTAAAVPVPKGQRGGIIFGNAGMICYIVVCAAVIVLSLLI